jgi:hypothetical protein
VTAELVAPRVVLNSVELVVVLILFIFQDVIEFSSS